MLTMNQTSTKKNVFPNDEFGKYLRKQTLKTTINGTEAAAFSWYKKILGLC